MSWLKSIVKKMMAPSPYRLSRGAANRFSAIEDSLRQLANSSFAPTLVIDGGAHTGEFSLTARAVFPEAAIHMIEPQPACAAALCSLRDGKGFFFHPVAITARAGDVRMVVQPSADTGAHVAWDTNPEEANIVVAGRTLDDLFLSGLRAGERILLKLDLQGHELHALAGATGLLPKVDVVMLEVSFFQQRGEPTIPDIVRFFDEAGLDLYDIAGLFGRTRDGRLRQGDWVFVRRQSPLWLDKVWE